jgi:tRNA(Ile)-lysidine synthase
MDDIAAGFCAAMDDLYRIGGATPPRLALGVSGGADSSALALLAHDWARARGGWVVALIADHGLRAESAAEAAVTADRMRGRGIEARIIRLSISPGSALQERAREARHEALATHAAAIGAVYLLFGHHADDQAEVLAMRARRGNGGALGMAAFASRHRVVLLRPLLGMGRDEMRQVLRRRGMDWIEDPSNVDPRFERIRVRTAGEGRCADPARVAATLEARHGTVRFLARQCRIFPSGYAIVTADAMPGLALAALIRVIGGAVYPPPGASVARLADGLRPATLGGVRIMRAVRLGGWLFCREPAACAPPVAARRGCLWDGRFRLHAVPETARSIGALGAAAAAFRGRSGLPAAVLQGLPAFFRGTDVIDVPHLHDGTGTLLRFEPPAPAFAMIPDDAVIAMRILDSHGGDPLRRG